MARWQSGYAADCKSVYTGSTPVRASIAFPTSFGYTLLILLLTSIGGIKAYTLCLVFLGSSVVEQVTVNHLVAGSNPARGATVFHKLTFICMPC